MCSKVSDGETQGEDLNDLLSWVLMVVGQFVNMLD
jgi:hypothetical protein